MEQSFACPAGEARSACSWIETTTAFFKNQLFIFIDEAVTVHCIQSNLKLN